MNESVGLSLLVLSGKLQDILLIYDLLNGLIDYPYLLALISIHVPSVLL